jgi:hypothetical protein
MIGGFRAEMWLPNQRLERPGGGFARHRPHGLLRRPLSRNVMRTASGPPR